MGRPPCCDKSNVKRGLWTVEEDAKILAYVANHGVGNWTLVPQKAGLNRCGKSCRLRWTNYLRPDLKHDNFTPQEEQLILEYHKAIGSRWSLIAKQLPGRTDNDVKNYWNTKLRKKLSKMGIDPITHKPISQILSEYGSISGLTNTGSRLCLFNNSINTTSMSPSEPSLVSSGLPNIKIINMPMIEQVQDIPFANYSWDSLAQFQVMNQETIQPNFFNEISSSASSSSSCSVTQLSSPQSFSCQPLRFQMPPSSPSSWREYLLADPFLSTDIEQEGERDFQEMLSSASSVILQNETSRQKFNNGDEHYKFKGVGHEEGERDFQEMLSPASSLILQNETTRQKFNNGDEHYTFKGVGHEEGSTFSAEGITGGQTEQCSELAASSSADSFVEAILDKHSEMEMEFPELLDDYLYYY